MILPNQRLSYVGILQKAETEKEMGENDMIGFDKLNDMQKKAVLQTEGLVLILAGGRQRQDRCLDGADCTSAGNRCKALEYSCDYLYE